MSICIGNVMEIVKIGKKTWQNAVIHQSFFTANVFYCTVPFLICIGKLHAFECNLSIIVWVIVKLLDKVKLNAILSSMEVPDAVTIAF